MHRYQPEGWHTVTPRIVVRDPKGLFDFLGRVFGATGEFRVDRPSDIRIGDSVVMVSGDEQRNPIPGFLYVYVADTDATYQRAVAAGAISLEQPMDLSYGDRRAMIQDAWGNIWQIATHKGWLGG